MAKDDDIVRDDPYADQQSSAPVTWGTPAMYGRTDDPASEGIVRDNPYGQPPAPPPPPPVSPATQALAAAGSAAAPPNTPLSQGAYTGQQIGSAENRKDTIEREANNLSKGQDEIARINREAEAEQRRMLFGNPEELLKAQQDLQAATAAQPKPTAPGQYVPPTPEMVAAQQKVQENMGAKPLLVKAMVDAENRDKALMAKINAAAAQEIDPNRWWNNKSTGGKVLAGIGMVLGGFGGGLQGTGRNAALDVMNKAIDDDIGAQRHHIDNSWKAISSEYGLNQDAFNRDLHRQTWEADFRKSAYEHIKLQLGQAAATTQSETVKNNAVNMIQTLSDEQAKLRNDQWRLGVQAQQAELNRMRALSKEADGDVQKLMEKDGVSYQDAVDAVYARPYFRGLVGAGMAPPEQAQKAALKIQFSRELEKQKSAAKMLGIPESDPRYQKMIDVVAEDPKYAPIFQKTGVVVPQASKSGVAQQHFDYQMQKDIRERTATVDGQPLVFNTTKDADDAAKKVNSINEVLRVNKEIEAIRKRNEGSTYMGSEDRAALDELLRQGILHYPLAMTGSLRINPEELKKGAETYSGQGDWFRIDALGKKQATINTLNKQLEERKREVLQGAVPAEQSGGRAPTPPAPPPSNGGNVGNSGKTYGTTVR